MYLLANYCDAPELVAVMPPELVAVMPPELVVVEDYAILVLARMEILLSNHLCCASRPVPVPAIAVWNPEVFDKEKNMWTSCRIRVTSCPNATASQPSIVHIGCGHLAEFWGSDALIQWNCIPHAFVLTGSQPMGLPSPLLGILRAVLPGHHL
ncbi:hypothetical protein EDD15DRAFT_2196916 [Pisolithus albus]|nr:hypothetical protein EDD15DRAFT_2196916 [Pisolithus albus]